MQEVCYFPTRKVALAAGATHYFNGNPCKHGHLSTRYADSGKCTTCAIERQRSAAAARPKYVPKGRDQLNVARLRREHYERNRDAYLARAANWRADNLERRRAIASAWSRNNPAKALANRMRRVAALLQRTPPWADLDAIKQFYVARPPGHEIDHIVPLRGKLVSGLHVLNNLQYLTPEANIKKLNKFDPDAYIHD